MIFLWLLGVVSVFAHEHFLELMGWPYVALCVCVCVVYVSAPFAYGLHWWEK